MNAMSVLGRDWLLEHKDVIQPFREEKVSGKSQDGIPVVASYGLSEAGYDVQIHPDAPIYRLELKREYYDALDIARPDSYNLRSLEVITDDKFGPFVILPPKEQILAVTKEFFSMPEGVMGLCVGKSTLARSGIAINATPLEPGWKGYLTLEIANMMPFPIRLYLSNGVAQIIFHEVIGSSRLYSGKYQLQPPRPIPPIPSFKNGSS